MSYLMCAYPGMKCIFFSSKSDVNKLKGSSCRFGVYRKPTEELFNKPFLIVCAFDS